MVLVVMGIILSMTTLTVGDGGKYRELEEEANRLKTLIGMALDESVLYSRDWRIAFKKDGYQFEQAMAIPTEADTDKEDDDPSQQSRQEDEEEATDKTNWAPIDNRIFRPRDLPGYQISLVIDDEDYLANQDPEAEDEEDIIGRVNIYYSGEFSEAFEVTIEQEDGDDKFILKATPYGELSLKSSRDEDI